MDEIFMQLTTKDTPITDKLQLEEKFDETDNLLENFSQPIKLLTGVPLMKSQFLGSFQKCRLHATRNWKIIFMQLLLPSLMVALSIIQILTIPVIGHQPSLNLALSSYRIVFKIFVY